MCKRLFGTDESERACGRQNRVGFRATEGALYLQTSSNTSVQKLYRPEGVTRMREVL